MIMEIYALSTNNTVFWFESQTEDVIGKMLTGEFRDENGNIRKSTFTVKEVLDISYGV